MGLGRRHARQHETAGFQKNAMDSTVFWEYKPQQQVMTVDGFPGVVTAVYDGPVPGYEEYQVTLDNGLGGGSYTASQLSSLAGTTASHDHEATGLHLASDDYPEMGSILFERPPIERMTFSAARSDFDFQHEETDTGGSKFPRRVDMTAHHPETGEEAGKARYFPPKRKGGPISIDEVQGHEPGAASALLDEIEHRHPGSSTKFLWEVKRNNNNPDVTGHAHERAGNPSDWDTHYPNVADTIHRGIALKLPSYSARVVNSAGNSKEDHLAEIHSAMPEGPNVGTHWTEDEHAARLFAHNAVSDYRDTIPVVLHAAKPERKDIETRQTQLYRGGVFPYGDPHSSENEIPVRRGRGVKVTGISWKPDAPHPDADEHGWVHHTYPEPKEHTAARSEFEGHDRAVDAELPDEIHRGFSLRLSPEDHEVLHDESRPASERAQILMNHYHDMHERNRDGQNLGRHWSTDSGVARGFSKQKAYNASPYDFNALEPTSTQVVFHAQTPSTKSMISSPRTRDKYTILPHSHGEQEVPVRRNTTLNVNGVSWARNEPGSEMTRHDFEQPLRMKAALEDLTDEDEQEAEPELPPCAYCGSDQMEIAGDTGRAQQARCQVCGGMMSAPYGLQFKPELIGDPSNHPKDDPDPASGGVPGAANMRVPVKRMNDSDYTASLHTAEEDTSYRMQHQAPDADYGAPLHDVENMMPGFYEHPEWYNHGQEHLHESMSVIHAARGNPEKKVRIYRALPAEHAGKGFNTGDWVSTSKSYARDHAKINSDPKHDWPVISTVVPAKHLHTEGDVHEWAYNGPHQPNANVAFKGGYHQEIRQRADGSIGSVQRKANPFKERANDLKEKGYSFSHYKPTQGNPEHTVVAWDPQENWAGQVKAHENGEVHHVEVEPEHAHEPLEQHMRDMIAREVSKKTGSVHEANERDWCTFRRSARCYYPGPAGPDGLRMSTPQDRGPCAWDYWQQQVCPISEPGPMALMQAKGSLVNDDIRDPEFRFHFTASWSDVRAKARRLRTEGKVNIVVATNEGVGGEVKGDHHVYETVLTYVPGTYKVGSWECGCKWAAYAWGRSPAYRRFEGRMCSHALAMQFEAQARGMFGRTVEPSTKRPKWLRHHTPVVTQYERDTGENLTRRAVPPGNMRRTYEGAHPQVYLRFGKWPEDERSHNNVMGWKEDGVSVYDLDHQGEPKDPDAGMSRWHDHDESCGPDCDLDSYNEEFASNDTGDEMRGRVHRAERNRARGSENPSDTGHLVTGHEVGVGHDGEPLLRNVKRVGDWIDHRHLLVPGAPAHRLARDPEDEDYEPPRTTRRASLDVEGVYGNDHALDLAHPPVYAQVIDQLPEIGPVDSMKWMAALGMTHAAARAVLKDASAELATGELHFEASLRLLAEEGEHEEAEKKRCPDCGAMISANDEKCPHCHHVFSKHEHHHGVKAPAEGDLMSRGMIVGNDWDHGAVHRLMNGQATAHDLLHHIDTSDTGDFWYPHHPDRSHEDNIFGAKEFAQSEPSEHPAQDLDRDRPIGEVGVVLVGHKPDGWDPENNPDHGLMGNSYIPHSADVPLHKIHYQDHNGDWHSADASGHSVHVVGGGYDHITHQGAKDEPERPTVAGVALKAADTGRVLMLQRGLEDEDDPAAGTWEFPGGHEEKGDQTSLHTGIREWEEETGHPFPEGGVVHHTWTSPNGVYQGHLVVIPEERAVQFGNGRQVVNPDNPDGDLHEQAAWWDPDHARKNPALREELKTGTPWKEIKTAGNAKTAATADPLYGLEEASPLSPPQHSNATNPASTGWATTQDPHSWDEPENNSTNLGALPGDGFLGSLHDEPEAALPSTDGAESELDDERQDAGLGQYDENDAELTPNTTLASAGSAQDIVARFQATAAAAALGGGKDGSHHAAQQASNKEIATAAKEFLSKKALKDFNYAEQQELINEGARDKTMARNSDVLKIQDTHYAALEAALAAEDALEDSAELFA